MSSREGSEYNRVECCDNTNPVVADLRECIDSLKYIKTMIGEGNVSPNDQKWMYRKVQHTLETLESIDINSDQKGRRE